MDGSPAPLSIRQPEESSGTTRGYGFVELWELQHFCLLSLIQTSSCFSGEKEKTLLASPAALDHHLPAGGFAQAAFNGRAATPKAKVLKSNFNLHNSAPTSIVCLGPKHCSFLRLVSSIWVSPRTSWAEST